MFYNFFFFFLFPFLVPSTELLLQDWLYEDGDDTTKANYIAKMDEIRFVAGPIIQRHTDKIEAEQEAIRKAHEEEAAKKRAAEEAKKKAEEETKKKEAPPAPDTEMKDADASGEGTGNNGDTKMDEVE